MKTYAERIRRLRKGRGLSQEELAARLGVSRSAVGMYETGKREPDFATGEAIADLFDVDMDYLMGRSPVERRGSSPVPPGFERPLMQQVPLIGRIACGQPITAEENLEGYVQAPADRAIDFALVCHGDSMIDAGIHDGDTAYFRKQPQVENGQIAVCLIDGQDATLKRFSQNGSVVTLMPQSTNPIHQPFIYDLKQTHVDILGLVVKVEFAPH